MKISFDLDDTLICYQPGAQHEPELLWYQRLRAGKEPLRLGARELLRRLHDRGWELWIYTTSTRPPERLRRWFRCHGIQLAGVINQDVHDALLRRRPEDRPPSKHPAAFGMDLHVDDSEGVKMEGDLHGFKVVVVAPDDTAWADKVWKAAEEIESIRSNRGA